MKLCRGCLVALTELEQADGDGRLRQHRPEARACQGSLLGSLPPLFPHEEGRGSRQAGNKKEDFSARSARNVETPSTHRFLNDNVVANCYANEECLDTPSGRAAGSRSTKYD